MLNNEQIEIPGIPFPDYFKNQLVSYGVLDNTNIGYIYLFSEWPKNSANQQFYNAVNALKNTDGLIIDMRWNLGGWAFFKKAFDILFNESTTTLGAAYRNDPASFDLTPYESWFSGFTKIEGNPQSFYDHRIAVLLGPNCVSLGDWTAYRLSYHPNVKFFGKASSGSLSGAESITSFPDWFLQYSVDDLYHLNQPGNYLNRKEFPIDFPLWHNADDAANGVDAVVEAAVSWIGRTGIDDDLLKSIPIKYSLEQNYPNPFNPTTSIHFTLRKENRVELVIYNVREQEIHNLISRNFPVGKHSVIWNGRDNSGKIVNSGVYLIRINAGDFTHVRKMTFIK
ncbi:T9SS type A sorting domain-containing protein [candidate division KSB1 bacterium]|nr:T9SS type A sorting domain-containing protein [candidate division KSB1 bacterium]MBL7093598.1 T9SS type A sorting domain-containing protein [candidate division KSB1 bacterium]